MRLDGKKVLVTGGAGFIGSHLVDRLLDEHEPAAVTVLDNFATGSPANLGRLGSDDRLSLLEADMADPEVARHAVDGVDVVFNLACLGVRHSLHAPLENHRVNAEGTLHVALAALDAKVSRFVHISTSEVFGTAQYAPMNEIHPTWPETVYGGAKLAGEAYARAAYRSWGMPTVVVRPFNNYGPRSHFEGDSGELIPRTIVRALCGLPPLIFGDGSNTRDFLHVTDTARALTEIAEADDAIGRTINVGYGDETSVSEIARLVLAAVGNADLAPQHLEERPGDVGRLWVDNTLVEQLIGFKPQVSLHEGITDLVAWFRAQDTHPEQMLARMSDRNWQAPASASGE